jgi:integrase
MTRNLARLSAVEVRNLSEPGMHHDGGGLYLHVTETGAKSWALRYMLGGRARTMGLGSLRFVTLADARKKAFEWSNVRREGEDPIEARARARHGAGDNSTFAQHSIQYLDRHKGNWDKVYADQWENTLKTYVYPVIGAMRPRDITIEDVRPIIEPLWLGDDKLGKEPKARTADFVRKRIELIIDFAKASDPLRDEPGRWRENPARWRGTWATLLPRLSKVAPITNYRSLPYSDLRAFLLDLRKMPNIGVAPLEFLILSAARTGMVINARWEEIDFQHKTWTIPKERMKNRKEFRLPLSDRAIEILKDMRRFGTEGFVFPGNDRRRDRIEHNTMQQMLQVTEWNDRCTVHGFRSTFSTWAAEETDFPEDIREMALAHTHGNATYAAYQRGDLLRKRRVLMDAWAEFTMTGKTPTAALQRQA